MSAAGSLGNLAPAAVRPLASAFHYVYGATTKMRVWNFHCGRFIHHSRLRIGPLLYSVTRSESLTERWPRLRLGAPWDSTALRLFCIFIFGHISIDLLYDQFLFGDFPILVLCFVIIISVEN